MGEAREGKGCPSEIRIKLLVGHLALWDVLQLSLEKNVLYCTCCMYE